MKEIIVLYTFILLICYFLKMERLNRQKHLTVAQRGGIIGSHLGGLSNTRIANTLNISVNHFHQP